MATKTEKLRKAYEFKLGKQLTDKLSDAQISLLSSYYNSLSEEEQRQIDNDIAMGKTNDLSDMAKTLIQEIEDQEEDIPEGLDDLLGNIRGTEEPPGALAIVPKKPDDLVEEEIDSQILSILGLEDVFDLTYEEYATLLKEKAVEARMTSSQMTTESAELITNEYKRVKGKTGSFKVKQKKIDINKVLDRKQPTPPGAIVKAEKLIPPSPIVDEKTTEEVEDFREAIIEELDTISEKLDELLNQIRSDDKKEKKEKEKARIDKEKEKKRKKESQLESRKSSVSKVFEKVTKPFVSFFDRIKQFFMTILIGSAVKMLYNLIKDPSSILNPIKNFINSIIGFLNGIIAFLWNMVISPINFVINSINSGISSLIDNINKAITLIPGAKPITAPQIKPLPGPPQQGVIPTIPIQQQEGGGEIINTIPIQQQEGGGETINTIPIQQQKGGGKTINISNISLMSGGGKTINTIPIQQQKGGGKTINISNISLMSGGGKTINTIPIQQQEGGGKTINIGDISLMSGGGVDKNTGLKISGFGKDTQLTALSPGEVVFSNPAGDFWGRDNLLAMNAMGGGDNTPKIGKLGISAMSGGGLVFGGGSPVGQDMLQKQLDKKYGISRVRNSIAKVKSGNAPKGIIVVPGHTYGGETPGATGKMGELKANKVMAQFIVKQVKQKDPKIPIQYLEKMFPDSDDGLKQAIEYYKGLESQGYEVLEIHHDAFGPDGMGAGLLGSYTNFSKLDSALASNVGSFGAGYKGRFKEGYGMNRGGISMIELAKLEGQYEQGLLKGDVGAKQAAGNPVIQAILDVYGGTKPTPPSPPTTRPVIAPLPIPTGTSSRSSIPSSSASANQAQVPSFSSDDPNNSHLLVVKSIYNLVG